MNVAEHLLVKVQALDAPAEKTKLSGTTRGIDRRLGPRFRQTGEVRGLDSKGRKLSGLTRDVGPKGVFFTTRTRLLADSRVYMVVSLTAGPIFSNPVQLYCAGTVVRTEKNLTEHCVGVAVELDRIKIVHAGSDAHE